MWRLGKRHRQTLLAAAGAFAANKVLVMVTCVIATRSAWQGLPLGRALYVQLVQSFNHFDADWYTGIATLGYSEPKATAFFPLYPMLMKSVASVLDISALTAGVLINNVAFFFLLYFFLQLAREDYDSRCATRATLLLALYPTSFYFSAPYAEAVFMLFSVLALRAMRRGRWLGAGAAGGAAALTRNAGVLLGLPYLIEFWHSSRVKKSGRRAGVHGTPAADGAADLSRPPRLRSVLWVALIGLGAAVYVGYLFVKFGDPLLFVHVQALFDRRYVSPWTTLYRGFVHGWGFLVHLSWPFDDTQIYHMTELIFPMLVLVVLVTSFRKLRPSYWVMILYSFVVPLTAPLAATPGASDYFMSFSRYSLVIVPLYFGLVQLLRRRWLFWPYLILSAVLLVVLTYMWASGAWVG